MERVTVSDSPKSKFELPRGTNAALDELAKRHHRTKSELVRQANEVRARWRGI